MSEPVCPQNGPYAVEVVEGRTYYWCQCGRSAKQPYCDGAHAGTGIDPVPFKATTTGTVYLCGCKKTSTPPYCDGTHNQP